MRIIDPLAYPDWDNLLLASPAGSFFHTSYWARVLHDTYGYRPCYLTSIHDDAVDVLVPVMEVKSLLTGKRGVSLPFTDYCDPIVNDRSDWKSVLEFLKDYGKNAQWKYLELRGGEEWFDHTPHCSFFYRHIMKLSEDIAATSALLKSSTKRNIKKATREGVSITRSSAPDAVKTFYDLHCLTRKRHGVPPQPFAFFQQIYLHIIRKGHGHIFLAGHRGKTVAAAVYFHFGKEAIYKFGASDAQYLPLRPNDLLMWEAIQWYCLNGFESFNLGRTESDNDGLRQFKKGWGAKEEEIKYFRYDFARRAFRSEALSTATRKSHFIQYLPLFLTKMAGNAIYRHIG